MRSLVAAFLDPVGNARDLPIAVVNQDAGAAVAGQRVREAGGWTRT